MTWQDPGGNAPQGGPGGQDDDATRSDWNLAGLDALVGEGGTARGAPGAANDAATAPPGPPAAPPPTPASAPPPPAPALDDGYGAAPGYPPATGAGMAWAPPPTERRTGMAYGGTFERVIAYFVDGVLLTLIGLGIYIPAAIAGFGPFANLDVVFSRSYAAGSGTFDLNTIMPDAGAVAALVGMALISAAISAAYFVFQWSGPARATLGMRILHLQVGNAADGRTITRSQAFKRWLALGGWTGILTAIPVVATVVSLAVAAWELILLITTATSPTKQGLHDRFAETAIVAPSGSSGNGVVLGCVLIIAAFVVMSLVAFVALIFLGGQVSTILSTVGESV